MKTLLFSMVAFIFFSVSPQTIQVVRSDYSSCMIPTNAGRNALGQTTFTFYNACPERVYVNACVADSFGETKLYKSFNAVPVGGRYTIYTFPDVLPNNIVWHADPINPKVPELCLKH